MTCWPTLIRLCPTSSESGPLRDSARPANWGRTPATTRTAGCCSIWMNDLHIPFIPAPLTRVEIAKARHLIEFELFGDFPFEDDASRSHAIAAFSPDSFVRPITSARPRSIWWTSL